MTQRERHYSLQLDWTGNHGSGSGSSSYRAYGCEHRFTAPSKVDIAGSAAPMFRGDAAGWNPEEDRTAAPVSRSTRTRTWPWRQARSRSTPSSPPTPALTTAT